MSTNSPELESQIRELLAQGQKLTAIKLYRETTGVDLKEAKDTIEAIERGEPVYSYPPGRFDTQNDALLEEQIKQLLARRQKIQAVRLYRETYTCGLKEAKDAVDAIEAQMQRELRTNLPATPAISDDPFAEDTQRNRRFLVLVLSILLIVIGGLAFFFVAGNGF